MKNVPQIDFDVLIEKQKNTSFKNNREVDKFYSDCANEVYDTFDAVCELADDIRQLPSESITVTLEYLERIKPQVSQYLDLLDETDFDCKNFDRLHHQLVTIEEELPDIIDELRSYYQSLK